MSWDELIAYNRRWVQLHEGNNHQAEAARRMTVLLDAMEALRSDDAIERAARAMDENFNPDEYPIMTAMFRDYAKTALEAAIEGEEGR